MQISPQAPAPELEERLLSACSTGLRARCIAAGSVGAEPAHAVAVVSWTSPTHVQLEVGRSGSGQAGSAPSASEQPVWVSRELDFARSDPELERWRSIGFTIAVLADDERLRLRLDEPVVAEAAPAAAVTTVEDVVSPAAAPLAAAHSPLQLDARALGGAGLVGGAPRLGGELRGWLGISPALGLTSSFSYSVAGAERLDLRWVDVSLGLGLASERLWHDLGARLRLEALLENVSATAQQGNASERRSAWVPGVALGADGLWHVDERWALSARADVFWLDGSTPIRSAGEPLGTSAGAGVLLGLGAGYRF